MSVNNELQKGLIATMRGDAALSALLPTFAGVPAVFFHVPQEFDTSQPYVDIFEQSMIDDSTDNTTGFEVTLTIHTWVEERTTRQTSDIMQAVYNVLNRNDDIALDNYTISGIDFASQVILRDPDGVTKHGVQVFTVNLEPTVVYPPCPI